MLSENSADELTVIFVDLAGQTFESMVKQPGTRSYLVARLRNPSDPSLHMDIRPLSRLGRRESRLS